MNDDPDLLEATARLRFWFGWMLFAAGAAIGVGDVRPRRLAG
ncbi:MAG TPA: hypothetical protein VE029_10100 [Rhizobacter sp.]|nr:hypothetical protein [Rhizobacter sp.]